VTGPVAAPRRARQRRFRAWHALAATGLIVLGALASGGLVMAASAEGSYLALAHDVDYATRITASDLTTVRVGSPPGLAPVPASDLDQVVGTYAAAPLYGGTLLTAAMLTADPIPGPSEYVVGVALRGDRLPSQRPRPGDTVLLVTTGEDPAAAEGGLGARTWTATVTAVDSPSDRLLAPGGSQEAVTLDVVVPVRDGPDVARVAAQGQLVVILSAGS
jgi:hypothetical protein